jgi:5-methylcytosine-specific restriction endonuclease McrA
MNEAIHAEDAIRLPVCLNCDGPIDCDGQPTGELFCSTVCKQAAKAVRYVRKATAEGRADEPDIAEAIRIKIGSVVGGGYPEKQRALSAAERAFVFDRDDHRCQLCGGKATEIDHIGADPGSDVNYPSNLQSVCRACHIEKTKRSMRPIASFEEQAVLDDLLARIDAPQAIRLCDSEEWAIRWRTFRKQRRDASFDWPQ